MSKPRNIYFTSDNHIGHENILKFADRPFQNIKHMENGLIKRWNSRVRKNDLVYILGDFIWSTVKPEEYRAIMNRLNGEKILIIGNHDRVRELSALNLGFRYAAREAKIRVGEHIITLSHYPYRWGFWKTLKAKLKLLLKGKRFVNKNENRPKDEGGWLLHGHTHSKEAVNGRQIHVGCDSWDCYPVSLGKILNIIENNS